ncbi:MAG: hypothetical protein KF747_12185 [Nitrospira sp.]|nr:hypothetical protein [Nitrospira sp.]
MKCLVCRSMCFVALLILQVDLSFSSTAVVVPLSALERVQVDDDHGVLLGTHHVIMNANRNGQGHAPEFTHSKAMEWHIEEVTEGKRFLTIHVPTHGPFVVRLPVGSYRVTMMRFPSPEGTWHGGLATTFEIRPGECTSLGTSMLQMQLGFVTGWISRHVLHEQEISRANHDQLIGGNRCLISKAPLTTSLKHPIKLNRSAAQE